MEAVREQTDGERMVTGAARSADARMHAEALVEQCGLSRAAHVAAHNAEWSQDQNYWRRVLSAVQDIAADVAAEGHGYD